MTPISKEKITADFYAMLFITIMALGVGAQITHEKELREAALACVSDHLVEK